MPYGKKEGNMQEEAAQNDNDKKKHLVLDADTQTRFDEFMKTAEIEQAFSNYLKERRGQNNDWKPGVHVDTRNRLLPFAESFVRADLSIANDFGLIATVEKILRRMRDVFEERANKVRKYEEQAENERNSRILIEAKEQERPGFRNGGSTQEKPCGAPSNDPATTGLVNAGQAGVIDVLLNRLESFHETQKNLVDAINKLNTTIDNALFVKPGALVDRKTGKYKHVGWSWFHSIHSEMAQVRGLLAAKREGEGNTAEAIIPQTQESKEKEESNG